jgi:hypothetical protein
MELEFQNYPKFTPEMKKTHKILIPNMAPVQFRILAAVMRQAGYTCELLENCGSQVSELGLSTTTPAIPPCWSSASSWTPWAPGSTI